MTPAPVDIAPVTHRIGKATVQKIWEIDLNGMTFPQLFPGFEDRLCAEHADWFPAGTVDAEGHR